MLNCCGKLETMSSDEQRHSIRGENRVKNDCVGMHGYHCNYYDFNGSSNSTATKVHTSSNGTHTNKHQQKIINGNPKDAKIVLRNHLASAHVDANEDNHLRKQLPSNRKKMGKLKCL